MAWLILSRHLIAPLLNMMAHSSQAAAESCLGISWTREHDRPQTILLFNALVAFTLFATSTQFSQRWHD